MSTALDFVRNTNSDRHFGFRSFYCNLLTKSLVWGKRTVRNTAASERVLFARMVWPQRNERLLILMLLSTLLIFRGHQPGMALPNGAPSCYKALPIHKDYIWTTIAFQRLVLFLGEVFPFTLMILLFRCTPLVLLRLARITRFTSIVALVFCSRGSSCSFTKKDLQRHFGCNLNLRCFNLLKGALTLWWEVLLTKVEPSRAGPPQPFQSMCQHHLD